MLEKYLQEIGLNDKEALVYTTLIQFDYASVIDIAKKTNINRTTVYLVIESLQKKGLVSETQVGKKTRYEAAPPERLETFIERQKSVLEERSKMLKDIIPQIKSIQRETGERPVVKYFEGREGIISSLEEFYSKEELGDSKEPVYMVYPSDMVVDVFSEEERRRYKAFRLGQKIQSKVFYTSKDKDFPSDAFSERIRINQDKYPITCDIAIYQDKIKISILGKTLSGIFIRSKDLADTLRSILDLSFDQLKQKNTRG